MSQSFSLVCWLLRVSIPVWELRSVSTTPGTFCRPPRNRRYAISPNAPLTRKPTPVKASILLLLFGAYADIPSGKILSCFPLLFLRSPFLPFYFSRGIVCSTPTDVFILKCLRELWPPTDENRYMNKTTQTKV